MIALIINYNRVTYVKQMADWCAEHNLIPIIIDNHSDYPPLLEYYYQCPYTVYRMKNNIGHKVCAILDLRKLFGITGRYIVTDPDLDLSGIPDDFLEVLNEGLDRYPDRVKCGFSLEIDDLPNTEEAHYIKNRHELDYWE